EVFNIAGQRVATLLKGNMPIGRHTLNFQTDDLASGIYLYQLRTGNQFLQRKMVIIK
ncbi:MAG: T9SS type A sorting domain-containing protein, partial [Calditrichia bacterium]|nr:T9SS type A sorting domain-containing protein [Calditrichia bacterium]